MHLSTPKISPLGDSAVVVEFGRVISAELNRPATGLAKYLAEDPFPGFVEAVPAYASTTVFFDPEIMRSESSDPALIFDAIQEALSDAIGIMKMDDDNAGDVIDIPSRFDEAHGPDLAHVAEKSSLSIREVIDLFSSSVYRVFMIGFLPGFAYMGEVDERIALPRRQQPRQLVPKGSIGIAGRQTGIYPLESPGGWQLIGRTEIELFTPNAEKPTLFQPGDLVRFVPA